MCVFMAELSVNQVLNAFKRAARHETVFEECLWSCSFSHLSCDLFNGSTQKKDTVPFDWLTSGLVFN